MNIDIRKHIINNFKDDNKETIKNTIEESIAEADEVTLPGMGVFLEIIWKNSNDNERNKIAETIIKYIKEKENSNL